jgi:hypothetical protein
MQAPCGRLFLFAQKQRFLASVTLKNRALQAGATN